MTMVNSAYLSVFLIYLKTACLKYNYNSGGKSALKNQTKQTRQTTDSSYSEEVQNAIQVSFLFLVPSSIPAEMFVRVQE